ncbi:hypothetical protein L0Z72_11665 [candidate division KSB1 bacterium]|nr:hypothetical protein [candidate division KSB1 bacterium]
MKTDTRKNTLKTKPLKYRGTREYLSPYPEPLIFQRGDVVEIGKEFQDDPDWKNWLWCEGANHIKAWVPKQFLKINGTKGIFNRDYDAKELSIAVGEELLIHEIVNGFGMAEKPDGAKGWVPMRNVELDES